MDSKAMRDSLELPAGWKLALALGLSGYVLIILCTRPYSYVDSFNYALHIVNHYRAARGPGFDPFWDFGHALWRPLGYLVWSLFRPILDGAFPTDRALGAGVALISISIAGGILSAVLLFLIAARISRNAWVAAAVTLGLAATDAVMNYTASGTAYIFGGCFQFAALYFLLRVIQRDCLTLWRGVSIGILLGISVVVWFPYCLSIPGLLCFGLLWPGPAAADLRGRIRFLLPSAVACVLVIAAVYGAIMARAGITSVSEARAWVVRNRYGIEATRGYLRMVAGIPRSFFYLGQDAVTWKRVLSGGEGKRPGIREIASSGLWKVAVVYLVLGWMALRLALRNRILLACLLVAAAPILYFAAFLFDPGPPERYYPVFPLLFLAFAFLMVERAASRFDRVIPLAFFVLMLAVNGSAMWRFDHNRGYEEAITRLDALNPRLTPNDCILVVSFPDPVFRFVSARPFDPASRYRYLIRPAIEEGTRQAAEWRQNAAACGLDAWNRGGHMWITTRLLARSPRPEWGWVETGDHGVRWADFPQFFGKLELLPPVGGPDGFAEVARSEVNRTFLSETARQ